MTNMCVIHFFSSNLDKITHKKLARVEQAFTLKREVTILFCLARGFFAATKNRLTLIFLYWLSLFNT